MFCYSVCVILCCDGGQFQNLIAALDGGFPCQSIEYSTDLHASISMLPVLVPSGHGLFACLWNSWTSGIEFESRSNLDALALQNIELPVLYFKCRNSREMMDLVGIDGSMSLPGTSR